MDERQDETFIISRGLKLNKIMHASNFKSIHPSMALQPFVGP
jgi:hypothetical protein